MIEFSRISIENTSKKIETNTRDCCTDIVNCILKMYCNFIGKPMDVFFPDSPRIVDRKKKLAK